MTKYIKDGKIKNQNMITVVKDGMTTYNPTHEMLLEDGWELYVAPEPVPPTEEELLAEAKRYIKRDIERYDSSPNVNRFFIQEIPVWLDKETRTGLMLRFEAEKALGNEETSLWYNGMQFPLPLENAIQMLYALEVYASQCYDNTQYHLAEINKLDTVEAVRAYDYSTGYPEKLIF